MARKKYNLIGIDGNAFSVLGYVSNAMRREGYSRAEIDAYMTDAKSKDYSHLLCVSAEMVDKLNANKK